MTQFALGGRIVSVVASVGLAAPLPIRISCGKRSSRGLGLPGCPSAPSCWQAARLPLYGPHLELRPAQGGVQIGCGHDPGQKPRSSGNSAASIPPGTDAVFVFCGRARHISKTCPRKRRWRAVI